MPLDRLHKVLANAGFGSRRQCEQLIAAGTVQVDGKVVTKMGIKVDPAVQKVRCGDRYVKAAERVVYLLNKPRGVVCTTKDEKGRRTVMHCLAGIRERVYPAGRLDADSQGMVILTNDGDLCARLTHPRFRVPKTYHVILRGMIRPDVILKARKGVWLSDGKTLPARVRLVKKSRESSILEVTLHEGMNREVRRIFARWGYKVRRLKRVRIGGLALGSLPESQFRRLGPEDLHHLLRTEKDQKPARGRSEEE